MTREPFVTSCTDMFFASCYPYALVMKLRTFTAALLTFWLVIGPVGAAWAAANMASPCESMSAASAPADDCCGDKMDPSACLSACMAAAPIAVASATQILHSNVVASPIPRVSLRYATLLAPPDIAPPKAFVS